ncbi:DUF2790 domain-containing protein [Pseudomonas sp. B21-056]|jgi:hypothetical protein|uniref:DUF2790 domain-containing protein n=1 Tax=Pseudomonas sp. B21-056 TaxID=2895495 RepID=UPI00222FAE95|nr:DUF2790 domain-containing protein [Pseudomonas sp. B21-056]UZE21255.1 DUF2790 domain-containing protein [Pseudomonas sp. B21-056]
MNTCALVAAASFLGLAGITGLAQANTAPPSTPYHYGMPLQIKKVLSLTEPSTPYCEVITAQMVYVDKAGETQDMSYRKLSNACMNEN